MGWELVKDYGMQNERNDNKIGRNRKSVDGNDEAKQIENHVIKKPRSEYE